MNDLSRLMEKPTTCIGENKDTDQLRGNREADQLLCFRYSDSTIPLLFQASSSFLRLYRPVCVRPVRKPHCWFSHEAAHLFTVGLFSTSHHHFDKSILKYWRARGYYLARVQQTMQKYSPHLSRIIHNRFS